MIRKLLFYLVIMAICKITIDKLELPKFPDITAIKQYNYMSQAEQRYKNIEGSLPNKEIIGFFSNFPTTIQNMMFINYVLAPRVFINDLRLPYSIIEFEGEPAGWFLQNNLSLVSNLGDNLYLVKSEVQNNAK